ncbi:MAG: hypothetical protein N2Z84_04180, partial [Atribacterota bacterium]|nr:hypothetical protein [Atribacterota bacterium]
MRYRQWWFFGLAVGFFFFLLLGCSFPSGDAVYNRTQGVAYSTIQEAINKARDGDEIVVAPGLYRECIDFKGKNVVLRSEDPENPAVVSQTIIDGNRNGSVVTFKSGEGNQAILAGFTIRNGTGTESVSY